MQNQVFIPEYESHFRTFSRTDRDEARYEKELLKKLPKKQKMKYLSMKGLSQ